MHTMSEFTRPISDRQLDVSGLKCPMPILRTKKTLAEMTSGEVLEFRAPDPATKEDLAAFARHTGHVLLQLIETDACLVFYLKRK